MRILIAEDEFLVGIQLEEELRSAGCSIVGPFSTLEKATLAARREGFNLALLDINLNGERVYPLADELSARGVPFIFLSGYLSTALPERFRRGATDRQAARPGSLDQGDPSGDAAGGLSGHDAKDRAAGRAPSMSSQRTGGALGSRAQSGRGLGPRSSGGTLQLSTRCSSVALLLRRSLTVRVAVARVSSADGSEPDPPPAHASPICTASNAAAARPRAEPFITVPFLIARQ
jgi:CheY-like chemotaxis protein